MPHLLMERLCSSDGCLNSFFDHDIRCDDCKRHFCHSCDKSIHFRLPFYKRIWLNTESSKVLDHTQFIKENGSVSKQEVPVPVFIPSAFQKYQSSSLSIAAGNDFCIVITANGRFDLSTALFCCNSCECTFDFTLDDCILSGFWPPVPDKFTFLCCSQLLTLWHHLKLLTPGTSEQKFLETISAMLVEGSRCPSIKTSMFARASQAHEFTRSLTDSRIKQMDTLSCRACIDERTGNPFLLSGHPDANHKLTRTDHAQLGLGMVVRLLLGRNLIFRNPED
ncbi:uncharacterized protein LOC116928408 isoform X2 [Daphnia magna]|uniref:uncharacterized protein LOC116928408 isoform X2 n=1 Tax=Daphnia magna TaxID=35525 RepID=UPI001E1BA9DA|nr:uncharacterized protein LOC116928408 isoform X2 [Daphnia magna]